jgi:hypothetical protein
VTITRRGLAVLQVVTLFVGNEPLSTMTARSLLTAKHRLKTRRSTCSLGACQANGKERGLLTADHYRCPTPLAGATTRMALVVCHREFSAGQLLMLELVLVVDEAKELVSWRGRIIGA